MALRAGKNVRWVAYQLGHADPALTLRVYAHAMPEDEADQLQWSRKSTGTLLSEPSFVRLGSPDRAQELGPLRRSSRLTDLTLDHQIKRIELARRGLFAGCCSMARTGTGYPRPVR